MNAAREVAPKIARAQHPRAVVRSALRYEVLRKLGDTELQAWIQANPSDAARISAASEKRRRKHEAKHGIPIPLATPEETSHAAG